jgi:hypothetical protein
MARGRAQKTDNLFAASRDAVVPLHETHLLAFPKTVEMAFHFADDRLHSALSQKD